MARLTRKAAVAILIAAAGLAPLLFGAASTKSVAWLLVFTSAALLLAAPVRTRPAARSTGVILALTIAWTAACVIQLKADIPAWSIPVTRDAAAILGVHTIPELTLNASRFVDALLRSLLVAITLTAAIRVGQNRNDAYRVFAWLVGGGILICVPTMMLHIAAPDQLLWLHKRAYVGDYTVAFVNRGAAGAWQSLVAIVALALLLRHLSTRSGTEAGEPETLTLASMLGRAADAPGRTAFLLLGFTIPLMGLFMTRSRAALLAVAGQGVIVALAFLRTTGWRTRSKAGLGVAGLATLLVLYNAGGQAVSDRVVKEGLFDEGRWMIWQSTLAGITERPLLGFGAGTFRNGFPIFRDAGLAGFGEVQGAHSLPLEIAFENGVPLAVLIGGAWLIVCLLLARAVLANRWRFDAVAVAALCAATATAALASIDVVSESFGYVVPMLVVVGIGIGQLGHARRTRDE